MPTIADQVATVEHDLAAALVLIDQLKASNDALTSANTGLRNENVAMGVEINNMKHFVDDTRAMVETLASSAYDMLRTTRRSVDTPAEVIPFAPKVAPGPNVLLCENREAQVERVSNLAGVTSEGAILPETGGGINREPSRAWRNGDSGDEQPGTDLILDATPLPPHAGPMLVKHEGDLPIFLKRDTPHAIDRAIFG